ncbi:MAG: HEAT repeat domain-containing protein, partial [Gemmataceae bacterium]
MRNCTPYRLRDLHPVPRTAYHWFRLLAPFLLMLSILAGSDLTSLHAQKTGFGEEKKKDDRKPLDKAPESPKLLKTDPRTPLKDVLPPPKIERMAEPVRGNDLSRVPEVRFEAPWDGGNAEALKHIVHQIAKINDLNDKNTDGFIEALRSERPDLSGLPFAMGDACRTKGERSKQFARAVATVRRALQSPLSSSVVADRRKVMAAREEVSKMQSARELAMAERAALDLERKHLAARAARGSTTRVPFPPIAQAELPPPETFWDQYQSLCSQEDKGQKEVNRQEQELVLLARIAALTQILMPITKMHPGFVKYLSTVSHVEATRTLARMAIFSGEDNARKAAIDALKIRRERDYTDILVNGLRYPWPAVARRAAEAIVKLERNDLLPQLIDVLEQPDPRAPVMQQVKEKRVPVVREMVRVNHHRSCLLCHAPGNTGKVSGDAVSAEVPLPGQRLNPPSGAYNTSRREILVRVDVTYLRQDFSALQAVADANPWPEMQRFDFLVRTRVLSDGEATAYRDKLK